MKKSLIILSLSMLLVCSNTSCSNNNQMVTLKLHPTIGVFSMFDTENNFPPADIREFKVKSGTLLKDVGYATPYFSGKDMIATDFHWSDDVANVGNNYKINKNVTLYAHYYKNVSEAQTYAIGLISDTFFKILPSIPGKTEEVENKILAIDEFVKSTTLEYGAIGMAKMCSGIASSFMRVSDKIDDIYNLSEKYFKAIIDCGSDLRGHAIANVGLGAITAVGEASDFSSILVALTSTSETIIEHIKNANEINSCAYGVIGKAAVSALKTTYSKSDTINSALNSIYNKLALADTCIKAYAISDAASQFFSFCERSQMFEGFDAALNLVLKQIDAILSN